MNRIRIALPILLLTLHCSASDKPAQESGLTAKHIDEVVQTCIKAFEEYYVYPDAVPEMKAYINARAEEGLYADAPDLAALTGQLRRDFRDVSKDRHIWIDVMENLRLTPEGPTPEEIAEKRKGNFGFATVKHFDDGIGYLKLDAFQDPAYAGETAVGAMQKLAGSRALIIDLRENHGGDGQMVHLVASYFLPARTQLTSLYFHFEDRTQEAWTQDQVEGQRMLDSPLFLLVSEQTTSAAESFAYTLQSYGRAKLVGSNTRGAGHWVESYPYPDQGIFLEVPVARPINPVTGKGWEHTGVIPDLRTDPATALDEALSLARSSR